MCQTWHECMLMIIIRNSDDDPDSTMAHGKESDDACDD